MTATAQGRARMTTDTKPTPKPAQGPQRLDDEDLRKVAGGTGGSDGDPDTVQLDYLKDLSSKTMFNYLKP